MGDSNYQTRNELLYQMSTGISKEIDAMTQARFDNGHETEALSRVIAEDIIGEELSPVSASDDAGYLTANFDGVTFPYQIGYEHKAWNKKLAASVSAGIVPNSHAWQLDQQILVGRLDYVLFVVSDGTRANFESIEYRTTKERTDQLMAAWRQYDIDLANYEHVAEVAAPVAEAIMGLPAVSIQATGMITASNLPEFKKAAETFIANIKTELVTDDDFANAEANVKFCKAAEDDLEGQKKNILAQTTTIDEVMKTIDYIKAQLAGKRLMLDKLVKSEKESRKVSIVQSARMLFNDHVLALETEVKPVRLEILMPIFADAIKGKSKLSAIQDAVDTMLANAKIAADSFAKDIRAKLAWCKENAAGHSALFPDLQNLMSKPLEDFALTITSRIEKQKADEAARLEVERARIQAEEEAKARAKVEAEAKTKLDAEIKEELETLKKYEKVENLGDPVIKQSLTTELPVATIDTTAKPVENVAPIRQVASARPSRIQMIEAVAKVCNLSYSAAESCLSMEFQLMKEVA